MKNLIIGVAAAIFTLTAQAGAFTLATGLATEKINNRLEVDLYQIGLAYQLGNGMSIAASLQKGYPKSNNVPDESRTEIAAGHRIKIDNFFPYSVVSKGWRSRNGLANVDYYTLTLGTRYLFNDSIYVDISRRYRDSNDIQWQTNTWFYSVGYNLSPAVSVQLQYGKTIGDFSSDQTALVLLQRF